jgi:hypothetical protein
MKRVILVLAAILLAASTGVFAQASTKPVTGHFAIAYAEPLGKASDLVDAGWNISGGATLHPNPHKPFGIRFDLGYSWFDASRQAIDSANGDNALVRVDNGYASMGNFSTDALYEFGGKGHVGGYFGVGPSVYTRYWALTRESLVSGIWCDPWTGWCYPYTTVGQVITDNDRLTKIGWNAVLAITFPLRSGSEIYIEGAYHRMNTEPATEYIPILLGWRW